MCGKYVCKFMEVALSREAVSQSEHSVCVYDDYACCSMRMSECVCVGAHVCVGGCANTNVLDLKREVPD